jgi:hypothetical protein
MSCERRLLGFLLLVSAVGGVACLNDASAAHHGPDGAIEQSDVYAFPSRFEPDTSSVAYSGQAARLLLVRELMARIGRINDANLAGRSAEALKTSFVFVYDFKTNTGGTPEEPITVDAFGTALLQQTVGEIGVASLRDKMRDIDLDDDNAVLGWKSSALTASAVADDMIDDLTATMVARQAAIPQTPTGEAIASTWVSARGIDYQQLLGSYLAGAVAFSQSSDDYIDDDTPGKGLLADNVAQVDGKPYTDLEHAWDEAFGYFGAARNYGTQTHEANAGGFVDIDSDGKADWLVEVNYGQARDAAALDLASATATSFGQDAFAAFLAGRHLITTAAGALTEAQLEQLRRSRDVAEQSWERAIAGSCIRSVNALLRGLDSAGVDASAFVERARWWSRLKGELMALQFNPRSPFLRANGTDYAAAHELVGEGPVLDAADFADSAADLTALRALIKDVYGFDDADVATW